MLSLAFLPINVANILSMGVCLCTALKLSKMQDQKSLTLCWRSLLGGETSAKCKSVRKPQPSLPETPVAITSASKYFQILPGPPEALQSALRLCKSILRGSWKHLQLWMCIQEATRSDSEDSQIFKRVRPPSRSVGDFESSSAGHCVPYSQRSGSYGSISRRHAVHHICLCYSHKIPCLILWPALFKYLYIYSYV